MGFQRYPLDVLADVSDWIFVMGYDIWHSHTNAGPNAALPSLAATLNNMVLGGSGDARDTGGANAKGGSGYSKNQSN